MLSLLLLMKEDSKLNYVPVESNTYNNNVKVVL